MNWFTLICCLATLGLEHLVLWTIRTIWPPVIILPEGSEIDIEALVRGQKIVVIPSKRFRWEFK